MVGFTDEWVFCLPVRLVQIGSWDGWEGDGRQSRDDATYRLADRRWRQQQRLHPICWERGDIATGRPAAGVGAGKEKRSANLPHTKASYDSQLKGEERHARTAFHLPDRSVCSSLLTTTPSLHHWCSIVDAIGSDRNYKPDSRESCSLLPNRCNRHSLIQHTFSKKENQLWFRLGYYRFGVGAQSLV